MAGIVGNQDLWIVGSRFYFEGKGQTTNGATFMTDLGTIDTISPSVAPNVVELKDSASGVKRLIAQAVTQIDEVYQITCKNFNLANLNTLFLGTGWSGSAETYAVTASAVQVFADINVSLEDINNIGYVGGTTVTGTGGLYLYQLRKLTTGEPIRNVAEAITASSLVFSATFGGTAFTEGTHWNWYDKSRGIIQVIALPVSTAPVVVASGSVATSITSASFVPLKFLVLGSVGNASSVAANRFLYPQTASASNLTGTGHVYWSRDNGASIDVREFPCIIQPAGAAISGEDYSSWTLTVTILANGTGSSASSTNLAGSSFRAKGSAI